MQDILDLLLGSNVHDAFVLLEIKFKLLSQLHTQVKLGVKVANLTIDLLRGLVGTCYLTELTGHVSEYVRKQRDAKQHYKKDAHQLETVLWDYIAVANRCACHHCEVEGRYVLKEDRCLFNWFPIVIKFD